MSTFQKHALLVGISVIAFTSLFFIPAIPQDPGYHTFVDQRQLLGIPNFLNVISNAIFVIVGFLGIKLLLRTCSRSSRAIVSCGRTERRNRSLHGVNEDFEHRPTANGSGAVDLELVLSEKQYNIVPEIHWAYLTFFIGVFAVGIGSGYYHLFPSNDTLIWDRLPMTVAFTAFFVIILSEFISVKLGKRIFIPLLLLGIFSVGYWFYTEQQGLGDLRMYGLVQFLPILLIPLILTMFPSRFPDTRYYWYLLGFYVLAKIFEASDGPVYSLLSVISGHSIKHLCAGIGCYFFYVQLKKRLLIDR